MKTVYIARHAKSSWDDPELPDVIRPLSERGRKASISMGEYMASMKEFPGIVISSPATRAYHTALNLTGAVGFMARSIKVDPAIYYDGPRGMLQVLKNIDDSFDSVLTVGHEPTCSDVIYGLCGEYPDRFATGSIIRIDLDAASWKSLETAKGKKIWAFSPKGLKDAD